MHRRPAVAGSFYPDDAATLGRDVRAYLGERLEAPSPAVALLAPHAGYMYSGPCAGATYREVAVPRRTIVLCPNHTGMGKPLSILDTGSWETPLGEVPIDSELAGRLRVLDPSLMVDALAHEREHSLEVQLPFLQTLSPDVSFVPVCVGTSRVRDLLALGDAIAEAIKGTAEPVLLVISSDMSHYIPLEEAKAKDARAIEKLETLDAEGLHSVVQHEGISMCGYCPAVAGMRAARALGASSGRLVAYTSSGDRTGDYREVVAYAGMVFH